MRTTTFLTSATAALVLALAACGTDDASTTGTPTATSTGSDSSTSGSTSSADFNDADVMYAQGMAMHHQQAIDMADILLGKSGVDPDVRALAERIKEAQGPEIRTMESWLEDWGVDGHGMGMSSSHGMSTSHGMSSGSGHSMGHGMDDDMGMMSRADLEELKEADGPQASKLFLDQMIEHHEGAVDMAEQHRKAGKNVEARDLSRSVITSQKAEITEMREMRAGL